MSNVHQKNAKDVVRRRAAFARCGTFLQRRVAPLIFLALAFTGVAQEVVTFDFPRGERPAHLPAGLRDWPKESSEGLLAIEVPLLAVQDEGALLVTVVFQDAKDRIIQARWVGEDQPTHILVENLSEDLDGWNERSFAVPNELLPGSLIFETDAEVAPIRRIALAWTWAAEVFMSPAARTVKLLPSTTRTLTEQDVSAQAAGPLPDSWSAGIWKAFLQEKRESMEEALQFTVPMEAAPGAAVFRAKVLGVSLDALSYLWVNGRRIGPLAFEIPELSAAGYYQTGGSDLHYAGWRRVSAVVPASYLHAGDNALVLDAEKGAHIKEALLELNFEKEGSPLALARPTAEASAGSEPALPTTRPPSPGPAVVTVPGASR